MKRHSDQKRNGILNSCSLDLSDIVQSHDPEIHNLNNRVWDRLHAMALEIEQQVREECAIIAEPRALNGKNAKGGLWWQRRHDIAAKIRAGGE